MDLVGFLKNSWIPDLPEPKSSKIIVIYEAEDEQRQQTAVLMLLSLFTFVR